MGTCAARCYPRRAEYVFKTAWFIFRSGTFSCQPGNDGWNGCNNSCGSNSVVYRSTREHLLEIKALLHDGSEAVFKALSIDEFHQKCEGDSIEANIYKTVRSLLSNYNNQVEIRKEFPKKTVERRNTGYAVDILLESAPF